MIAEPGTVGQQPLVELTWPEITLAANIGTARRLFAVERRLRNYGGGGPNASEGWGEDIVGAIGEAGLAKHYNLFWSGTIGQWGGRDVGPFQVRAKTKPEYRLGIKEKDADDQQFVSVLVDLPRVWLCGWFWGGEGKRDGWRDREQPYLFWVPTAALHPMATLTV